MSFSIEACVPAPVCESKKMDFKNIKKTVAPNNMYLGDPSKADWVSSGEPAQLNDYGLLTMGENSYGTVLSSTRYMWYGNVKARMKTSRGRGVVTAFILFSDVKDEIDFEWVGVDLQTTQTNYYFQGIPDCKFFNPVPATQLLTWHLCRPPLWQPHHVQQLRQLPRL